MCLNKFHQYYKTPHFIGTCEYLLQWWNSLKRTVVCVNIMVMKSRSLAITIIAEWLEYQSRESRNLAACCEEFLQPRTVTAILNSTYVLK